MFFSRKNDHLTRHSNRRSSTSRKLRFERLEDRQMLAVVWANEGSASNDQDSFNFRYLENAVIARSIVHRAIDDWNKVILDQNYDNNGIPGDNNLTLTIQAADLAVQLNNPDARGVTYYDDITTGLFDQDGWEYGVPRAASIYMDDNGASSGWFFDPTPTDDVEFTGIVGPYQASFVDENGRIGFNN